MRDCMHKQSMCTCIDWKNDDLTMQVNHLMTHFAFSGFELEYTTLESEENRRLCKVGRCRICGNDLCVGTRLPAQDTTDGMLSKIYRWMYQMWKGPGERLPEGIASFRDMFLSLFHQEDRELVREWLSKPENQSIYQMYRKSGLEVW